MRQAPGTGCSAAAAVAVLHRQREQVQRSTSSRLAGSNAVHMWRHTHLVPGGMPALGGAVRVQSTCVFV